MIRRLFNVERLYHDELQRQQAIVIISFVFISTVSYFVYAIFFTSTQYAPDSLLGYVLKTGRFGDLNLMAFFILFAILSLYFVRIAKLNIASWTAFTALCFLTIGNTYNSGLFNGFNTMVMMMTILVAGLLLGIKGLYLGFIVTIAGIILALSLRPSIPAYPDYIVSGELLAQNNLTDFFAISLSALAVTVLAYIFMLLATKSRQVGADEAVQTQLNVAQIVTELTRQTARRVTVGELSNYTIERILIDFPQIYHAQIFLTDDTGSEARLFASTGEVGKQLIQRAHGLKVGSVSVIGQVTYLGKYIVAKAGSKDTVHKRNELLPDTQVEAAFPLRIGDRIIGALDLQSKTADSFDREDLAQAFQTLADSIGLAIDNIRQYDRAEERVKENQRLVEETREALRQVERLNRRLTGRAWGDYINGAGYDIGASVDFEANQTITQADITASITEAIQSQQLVQTIIDDRQVITIPLRVRGHVVGAMEFELGANDPFTPNDLELIQEVSDRFGVAIENVRLFNESQRTAQREALVNQIVSRLQTMNNVEDMVTEAAIGLREALKANKIAIKLGTPPR
jgi:GAF domain-containing protein